MREKTEIEAFEELDKAIKEFAKAIEYEIHILERLRNATELLKFSIEELEKRLK